MSSIERPRPERGAIIPAADGEPLVSVIIAVYNDESHVAAAIGSVLTQTLSAVEVLVVDDGSSDASFAVAQQLAARDRRVTAIALPKNTGSAGAPRNLGIQRARGRYVMFLDSDDTLERHACANVVRAGDRDGSDLIMGRTERFDTARQKTTGWYSRLFGEARTLASIEEDPELIRDTSVAKACRTEFLRANDLRYPEDIHYEDLVFAAAVQIAAKGITVIPEVIYTWNTYPTAMRKSITHQRDTLHNVRSRVAAVQRVLDIIRAHDAPAFLREAYIKIIVHDTRLFINDIADSDDDDFARQVLAELQPLIRLVPAEVTAELDYQQRFGAAAILSGQPNLVRHAARMLRHETDLAGVVEVSGHILLWEHEALSTSPAPTLALNLATAQLAEVAVPWPNARFAHRIESLHRATDGHSLTIVGTTDDPLRALVAAPDLSWTLRVVERTGLRRSWTAPINAQWDSAHARYEWNTTLSLPGDADFLSLPRLTLRVDLRSDEVVNTSGIFITKKIKLAQKRIGFSSRLSRVFNAKYRPYKTVANTLALRPAKVRSQRARLRALLAPVTSTARAAHAAKALPLKDLNGSFAAAAYRLFRSLPLKKTQVFAEAKMGRSHGDSPGAIAAALQRRARHTVLWSVDQSANSSWAGGRSNTVIRGSLAYLWALARSAYLIDNQTLPAVFRKRPQQTYVQTWHGIPLKKMGLDQPEYAYASPQKAADLTRRTAYWDYLTVPSEYFERVFVPAFDVKATLLPHGTPRNDVLARTDVAATAAAKAVLGLDTTRRTVLYAPTFRDTERGRIEIPLDLDAWVETMSEDTQLLLRCHYLNRISVPARIRPHVVDVSSMPDATLPMQAADLLVTDYSSIMFDYLALDRPQVLYAYDLERYEKSVRGTYFSLREHAPGPLVFEQQHLQEKVRSCMDSDSYRRQRHAFRDTFAGKEPGDASERTVDTVWRAR
ncbi:CDP-glycerol glycerophosphotransferase family protein [Brevibacterium sp. BRM-1]|uniref:CDP-glycerol glycerophosphotransferase family protein n=1 Tax=Brevibacterium sp. BRM-1 TaxID=2999062 RepID=UPI002280A979|nr:CDP-glycerol glycerophosphotransferase family protein [Brevibacterium sp. BRM-1]WAL40111.1 CDP-glycerol glycerophosphotransferase family protein [Brevibacterium sp. BRM-1]